jgi:hypothetical protein
MNALNYQSDYQIQQSGLEVLHKNLGVIGFIRFMQQFDKGYGNYVEDRQVWQQEYSVDQLIKEIKLLEG